MPASFPPVSNGTCKSVWRQDLRWQHPQSAQLSESSDRWGLFSFLIIVGSLRFAKIMQPYHVDLGTDTMQNLVLQEVCVDHVRSMPFVPRFKRHPGTAKNL